MSHAAGADTPLVDVGVRTCTPVHLMTVICRQTIDCLTTRGHCRHNGTSKLSENLDSNCLLKVRVSLAGVRTYVNSEGKAT